MLIELTLNGHLPTKTNKLLEVPRQVKEARAQTLNRVRRSIREEYGDRYDVETFGSIR